MSERSEIGVSDATSFFSGNVGGGVLIAAADRLGLRADYRFLAVKDDAPAFFGIENRFGHRIAGGVVFSFGR